MSGSRGSGSSTSQQRRSSVLGPDPRDCIDLYDDGIVEEEARESPLPYDQQKQATHALAYNLAALVNAGTVDRCLSDSRGQVDLIGNNVADHVTKNAVDTCDRIGSARSADHSNDAGDDNASYEFEQEYFYCPTTSPETVDPGASGEGAASVLRRTETPRCAVCDSSSSSSSTPRWVLSLAEETPFTPFVLSATGVATAPTPLLHVSPAIRATTTAVAAATEEQLKQGHLGTSTGAQQQIRIPTQRLSVHKLVAAVLSSTSSTCTGDASGTASPVLAAAPTPMASAADEAEDISESRPEEPLPRRPPGCDEGTLVERERLRQRIRDTRARLTHVDQLIARFDIVLAARQAELERLREKQAVIAQQAESYKSRAATTTREVRRLRERQHGQDEVRLLCNMMADTKNRLHVAQSQLSSLRNLWKQLQLLHTAAAGTAEGDAEEGADHVRCATANGATGGGSAEGPREKESTSSSPASSVASLDTCNAISDFLEELLGEVEGLAKVCIQLPSAPPAAALSSCNSMRRIAIKHLSGAADQGLQRAQPSQSRPTYTTLNRSLNNGNNGFFSFFGGATEAHLDSKPLSTFLANLDRLARTSWEREEELQLRARELATEAEEDSLKARLALEYGVKPQQPQLPQHLSGSSGGAGERMGALFPLSPVALSSEREEEHLSNGGANGTPALTSPIGLLTPPNDAVAASTDCATRQISLSSPEHGRRSRGSSIGPRTSNGIAPLPSSASSSLLHHRVTPAPFLLPTLVYAYPRVAAVSQHLDAEQQQIQADYAAVIEAERQGRRQLTMQLRDTYRQHVAPVLRRAIDALRRHQTSLVRQLAELGVKAVTIQWEEEEESEEVNDAALLRAIDSATAAGQKPLRGIQRRRATSGRSRSRASVRVSAREKEEDSYGNAPDSQCTSLARSEYGGLQSGAAATPPPCRVYRRTLRITCAATCKRGSIGREDAAAMPVSSPPLSGRHPHQTTMRQRPSSTRPSAGHGCLSARSACKRPSSASCPSETAAEPNITTPLADSLAGTASKACAALQLCTHSPTKALYPDRRNAHAAAEETQGCARAAAVSTAVTPIATLPFRRSGGTPRVSGATAESAMTRASTAVGSRRNSRGCASAVMPPSPRQSCGCAASPTFSAASRQHRCNGGPRPRAVSARFGRSAAPCSSSQRPVVEDVRELAAAADSAFSAATRVTMSTSTAANVWSPFQPTGQALADGAVRVTLTFTGEEARRRQAAQARQEAHQRKFWGLREELARIDEDTFQLRTRYTELQSTQQSIEAEHRTKLAEAEAKMKKYRAFYESLRRENKEWQSIRGELERVIRGE
ncbi:hypothetical protein LMJF_18_1020 [Leishmania major strain Friedlin]|uniref:Uncharacterized protein n=1 Tax=Leishmania major TaxID=5664 RepID=Q4QDU0_LEIMA|nr:hypothetical protein LMJF_18_1020 [Leishmania major strain Friedlin]CAG9572487.1 hypothetical_protein_-_conserved [Leishmania major strain Friedlin]CAJ03910.1 hypothetical protein LMJF_18_1020 [Leishmania major strain Friedlin]|eukprot:XP_001682508.1 hypothetical protein LMJF_18_1020 [Leishmania major strain Friedlin]